MKGCQKCNFVNNDAMNFCLQCGAQLPTASVTDELQSQETQILKGVPTNFVTQEFETFDRKKTNAGLNISTTERPKSNGKIFLIIGGLASLFILGFGAIFAIVAYNYLVTKPEIVPLKPTPTISQSPNIKSPTPLDSPTPATSFTPPTEATKKGSVTIYANRGWQLSEINVVEKEKFQVNTVGIIDIAGVKTQVRANGFNDKKSIERRLYPEYPTGALLFRTHYPDGHFGNVLPVSGGYFENFPDEFGRLEFCINDKSPESNGGQFTVTVTMTSVPKTKK
jgi:hypothetical protein